jgi:uncharacterized damage-inducible protein DinB
MQPTPSHPVDRRGFLTTATGLVTGLSLLPETGWATQPTAPVTGLNIVGPMEGYAPQIGTLLSMMNWMRTTVLRSLRGLSKTDLDYLHDPKANSIGAMLMHLVATEFFYQVNTFEGRSDLNEAEKKQWEVASELGDAGRQQIKGNNLDYYLNALSEVRTKTKQEFKQRDDAWLMTVDPKFFGNQPTNNYCKWFHVAEHESNHNGQIKWIKGRLPGAKPAKD